MTPFNRYFKLYYKSRIKDTYLQRYAVAKKAYDEANEADKESGVAMKPVAIQLKTEVSKEFWLLETKEFRESVAQDAEDVHAKDVEELEQIKLVPKTAVQFHQ